MGAPLTVKIAPILITTVESHLERQLLASRPFLNLGLCISSAFTVSPDPSYQTPLSPVSSHLPSCLSLAFLCRGGAELLFDGVKKHQVTLPGQEGPCEYWISWLLSRTRHEWGCDISGKVRLALAGSQA